MVIGKLLFEAGKYAGPRLKEGYDLLYAVGVGTAIGIGSNPTIRGSYELWKGTNRSNIKARNQRWDYRSLRRRFKGDVFVDEAYNPVEETYRSDIPGYGRSSGSSSNTYSGGRRRSKYNTHRHSRRCTCKSRIRRTMVKQRKRYRSR